MTYVLQINLQRSATAQSLLQQTSAQTGAHVLAVSEPNWHPADDDRWVRSDDGTYAVALTAAADFVVETHGAGRGYAWTQGRGLRLYSCYNSRNDTTDNFAAFLDDVQRSASDCDRQTHLVICGDFNAWSQEWGSRRNDRRGEQLADLAASLGMTVENTGNTATYRRINAESIIDITFSRLAASWKTSSPPTTTDTSTFPYTRRRTSTKMKPTATAPPAGRTGSWTPPRSQRTWRTPPNPSSTTLPPRHGQPTS